MRTIVPIPLILMLAACGGSEAPRPAISLDQADAHLPRHPAARGNAAHDTAAGSLIGADAETLIGQFGEPRLDIRDGDARKLQWTGAACVLDAYLYPGDKAPRAVATYIDARRSDGRAVDRAACVAALRKK